MASDTRTKTKKDALSKQGTLNPCPQKVTAPLFQGSEFFDPHDILQVKYEMLRHATKGTESVTATAAAFGFPRVAFYQIRQRYDRYGLAGLLPKPRCPRRAHKLTAEVMDYIKGVQDQRKHITTKDLCEKEQSHFNITVHPRSIERALTRRQKKTVAAAAEVTAQQQRLACPELITRYEFLRRQALAGCENTSGLALLRFRGLAAWLSIWKDCFPEVKHTPNAAVDSRPQKPLPNIDFSDQIRSEFIVTLAGIASIKRQ